MTNKTMISDCILFFPSPMASQVLHAYQKDQFRRGLSTEIDSREYGTQALHERIRRFYHNQRVFFLKNLQEFFRIDQDPTYFRPELRDAVSSLIDELDSPVGSLADKLQVKDRIIYFLV